MPCVFVIIGRLLPIDLIARVPNGAVSTPIIYHTRELLIQSDSYNEVPQDRSNYDYDVSGTAIQTRQKTGKYTYDAIGNPASQFDGIKRVCRYAKGSVKEDGLL